MVGFGDGCSEPGSFRGGLKFGKFQKGVPNEDGDVGEAVQKKAARHADHADEDSGHGGTDGAGEIKHGGVEGDAIDEILTADEFDHKGLARGDIKGVDESEGDPDGGDVPDLDHPGVNEEAEGEGEGHGGGLGAQEDLAFGAAVGHHPAPQGEEGEGEHVGETDHAEGGGGAAEFMNEPAFGGGLEPGADQRDDLTSEKDAVVPVAKGRKGVAPFDPPQRLAPHIRRAGGGDLRGFGGLVLFLAQSGGRVGDGDRGVERLLIRSGF